MPELFTSIICLLCRVRVHSFFLEYSGKLRIFVLREKCVSTLRESNMHIVATVTYMGSNYHITLEADPGHLRGQLTPRYPSEINGKCLSMFKEINPTSNITNPGAHLSEIFPASHEENEATLTTRPSK